MTLTGAGPPARVTLPAMVLTGSGIPARVKVPAMSLIGADLRKGNWKPQ